MERRRAFIGLGAALSILVVTALGAYVGVQVPALTGDDLEVARQDLEEVTGALEDAEARIEELRRERDGQREMIAGLTTRLAESEREVGTLQSALALSGPLTDQYTALTDELATARAELTALQTAYDALASENASFVRIRTPELPGDALLLDRSVKGVTYTGAVCSGSMEPTISCDDLLILYEAGVTDLDVGDVIYFRRPNAECTGYLEGRFMLHRIVEVTAGTEGLAYRTKGDALSIPDACPVPAGDVLYKLLTSISDARIDG